jgi:zinc/manganese transport system permease protein
MTLSGSADIAIIGPALLIGLLVLASAAPLGLIIVRRRGPFTSLALAQTAAAAVIIGEALWGERNVLAVQVTALAATLICAAILTRLQRRAHSPEVTAAGVFAVAAAADLMVLARDTDGPQHLMVLLSGRILAISPGLLAGMVLLVCAALMVWWLKDAIRHPLIVNLLLGLVACVAVQIVGLVLVLITVTVPAAAARRAPVSWQPFAAFNIGAVGYAMGLAASLMLSVPAGPAIVCTVVLTGMLTDRLIGLAVRRVALLVD